MTTRTSRYERSKKHPRVASVYVLPNGVKEKLDPWQQSLVEFTLSTNDKNDGAVFVETPVFKIFRFQLLSLKPRTWVHCGVVDAYAHILNVRTVNECGRLTRCIFPLAFGNKAMADWKAKVTLDDEAIENAVGLVENAFKRSMIMADATFIDCDYVLFPTLVSEHYLVYSADLRKGETFLLDSDKSEKNSSKEDHASLGNRLFVYASAFLAKKGRDVRLDEWKFQVANAPQQVGNHDCGIFACEFMEHWKGSFEVDQITLWKRAEHVELVRAKIAAMLLLVDDNSKRDELIKWVGDWDKEKEKGNRKKRRK